MDTPIFPVPIYNRLVPTRPTPLWYRWPVLVAMLPSPLRRLLAPSLSPAHLLPLFEARRFNDLERLVRAGAKVKSVAPVSMRGSLLGQAVSYSQTTLVDLLLDRGADPNHLCINPQSPFVLLRRTPAKYWSSPLHKAVHTIPLCGLTQEVRQIIQSLLNHGARLEQRDSAEYTPRQLASSIAYPTLFDRPQVHAHALLLSQATQEAPASSRPPRRL